MNKLKNSNCDETLKTQIVMKLKNTNGYKPQKLKWGQNSKTQILTKLKNLNCDKPKKNLML